MVSVIMVRDLGSLPSRARHSLPLLARALRGLRIDAAPPRQGGDAARAPRRRPDGAVPPAARHVRARGRVRRAVVPRVGAARAPTADCGQGGAVRVRDRARPRAGRALPGALLPGRDDLHHLRHRDHLPLPVGRGLPAARAVRAVGDGGVRGRGVRLVRLPDRQRRPRLGPGEADASDARPRCVRHRPHHRVDGPAGRDERVGARPRSHGPRAAQPQLPHRPGGGPREVGPAQQRLARHLRARVLRDRDDGDRRGALRPEPLRHGGLPRLAPPGRPHDRCRPGEPEDGARAPPDLRPDDGAEVGHLDGRLRVERRHVQQLRHRAGRRPDRARRRLRAGLPSRARDAASTRSSPCTR